MGVWRRLVPLLRQRLGKVADADGSNAVFRPRREASSVASGSRSLELLPVVWHSGCYAELRQVQVGLSTVGHVVQNASRESADPVRSPLSVAPGPLLQGKPASGEKVAKAVLSEARISPKKVNLVAALIRGMRCSDALQQMEVLPKRAAKVVYKVVHSARANAVNNHGLDKERLVVSEAFVGTGTPIKRTAIQARNRRGRMKHPRCNLTIILKAMSDEQEAHMARLRVMRTEKFRPVKSTLVPHIVREMRWRRLQEERMTEGRSRVPPPFSRSKSGMSFAETNLEL